MRKTAMTALLVGCCLRALAGELWLPSVSIQAGGIGFADIRYVAGTSQVAALQFDLRYGAFDFNITASVGPAAAVSKTVAVRDVAPGIKRILLLGLNQTALADGAVVSLTISNLSRAPGYYDLKLTDVIAADPDGRAIALNSADGVIWVISTGAMVSTGAFGQIVSGGPWKTTIILLNVSAAPVKASLNFWDSNGHALVLPIVSRSGERPLANQASSIDCSLESMAMCTVESEGAADSAPLVGWAELSSSGEVVGFELLRSKIAPDAEAEASVPLDQRSGTAFVLAFDDSPGFRTGVAIANRSPESAADWVMTVRDESGNSITSGSLSLPARGHTSFEASERFPEILGRKGTIELRNNLGGNLSILGIRFSPSGSFTSVPVIAK